MSDKKAKVIVVTGVTRGLGRALASGFVKAGHTVIGYCSSEKTGESPKQLTRVYANQLVDHFATTNADTEIANGQGFYAQGGSLCWVP